MTLSIDEKRSRQRAASRRWRENHPLEYQTSQRKSEAKRRGKRTPASAGQRRRWRLHRLVQPGYRERVNAVANQRATKIRRALDAYKMKTGCVDCGFRDHPVALEFDHVNGNKERNVCQAKSLEAAMKEAEKCEIRCANCHRIRHSKMTYDLVED